MKSLSAPFAILDFSRIAAFFKIAILILSVRSVSSLEILHLFDWSHVFLCTMTLSPSALISFDKNLTVIFKFSFSTLSSLLYQSVIMMPPD